MWLKQEELKSFGLFNCLLVSLLVQRNCSCVSCLNVECSVAATNVIILDQVMPTV